MLPWVIIFNAISLDGRINGFNADMDLYYKLASKIDSDAILMGSETVLTGFNVQLGESSLEDESDFLPRVEDPEDQRPLLVVPDSSGKIRIWSEIRKMHYIRDVLVLCSRSTPQDYFNYLDERFIPYIIVGYEKVDLKAALEELNKQLGVKLIRVDSGGVLNSALLQAGLVDEVHVIIHPLLVGLNTSSSMYNDLKIDEDVEIPLKLVSNDILNDGIVYLTYQTIK